jgi:protein-tyrosine kinase
MTIQEALDRAKSLARARAAETGSPPQPPPLRTNVKDAGPTRESADSQKHARQLAAPAKPILQPARFESVELNLVACAENRILAPGGDDLLEARGAAAYRILRTRILQRVRTNGWTAIGFTSPGPTEGKSVTAINLALAIAKEMNNNVFLVDLDLRNPSVARYLGVMPPHDLVDFLAGHDPVDGTLFSVGIENLLLAGSTQSNKDSSELIAAGRHMELFAYIASISSQPLILVDLPPVLSTDEAMVIAPQLDAVFMVVGEGSTRRDGLARSVELLSEFHLAGIILNKSRGVVQEYYSGDYGGA